MVLVRAAAASPPRLAWECANIHDVEDGIDYGDVTLLLRTNFCGSPAFIHPSAWKGESANFAFTEFSEVRLTRPTLRRPWTALCTLRPIFHGSVAFVSATGSMEHMIRVLVTLSPRMYRQAIALSIQRGRPGLVEVRLAPLRRLRPSLPPSGRTCSSTTTQVATHEAGRSLSLR